MPQYHVVIPTVKDTFAALSALVEHEVKEGGSRPKIIVFGSTARLVGLYAEFFRKLSSLQVFELHSRLSQPLRTRTTKEFKEAASGIMFASDVIGRGMDFPNVTSVIQVGLPANGEQYVHRVGRTARVDRDGRAVILLTQAESFFLTTNKQLPILPYVSKIDAVGGRAAALKILAGIDETDKSRAYGAYLGFMKGFMKSLRVDPAGLVAMANELAVEGFGYAKPPPMEKKTVGKMGLRGVAGIRYSEPSEAEASPKRRKTDGQSGKKPSGLARTRGRLNRTRG